MQRVYIQFVIFVSHNSRKLEIADTFRRLVIKHTINPPGKSVPNIFLSSDAHSIKSGEPWVCRIFSSLRECKFFAGLIVDNEDLTNRWIPFEAAYVMGREVDLDIFVFGQVPMEKIPAPLSLLQLINTGNTDRVWNALQKMGVIWSEEGQQQFAHLFRQCGCCRNPKEPCPGIKL